VLAKAGRRAGFAGPHSSLFREVVRLIDELSVSEVILENVAAITSLVHRLFWCAWRWRRRLLHLRLSA